MPLRNPTDKVHYIVRFRDWRLTRSVTLALDVPKIGTIGSGEFNNRRLLAFQPSFSFRGLSERESSTSSSWSWISEEGEPPRGYLSFGTKEFELGSVNWNVYYPYRGSSNWEDPSTWDEEKGLSILFSYVIKLNQWFVIGADSNNHFIRHTYFWFSNGFTSFINGNFLM